MTAKGYRVPASPPINPFLYDTRMVFDSNIVTQEMMQRSTSVFGPIGSMMSDMMTALLQVPFKPVHLEFTSEVKTVPAEGSLPEVRRRIWKIHEREFPEHGVRSHPAYFNCLRGIVFWRRIKAGDSWEKAAALIRHLNVAAPPSLRPRNITVLDATEEQNKLASSALQRPKAAF